MIVATIDHVTDGIKKLREQYQGLTGIESLATGLLEEINTLEQAFFAMYTNRSIQNATGYQLDLWGITLNRQREGLLDDPYRIALFAKIGENLSSGTADDLANIYSLLTRARYTHVTEEYPAGVNLTAVGADVIGTITELKAAVQFSRAAGVHLQTFAAVNGIPFVFLGDNDPEAQGFANINDSTVGGSFASIL